MNSLTEKGEIRLKPILFSTPMVRAILKGKKTQTRRVVNWKPYHKDAKINFNFSGMSLGYYCTGVPESGYVLYSRDGRGCWNQRTQPMHSLFGEPGDILYVRETWADLRGRGFGNHPSTNKPWNFSYKADIETGSDSDKARIDYGVKWKPSIHMPREAARIFLKVINARIEQLQDITPFAAWNEGCRIGNSFPWKSHIPELQQQCRDIMFKNLWNSINENGYGWDVNPWVWVVEFERTSANVNTNI